MAIGKVNLLSSQARIQAPWVSVTIGDYTFGSYSKENLFKAGGVVLTNTNTLKYPNYVQRLTVVKINGQINKYSVTLAYPITQNDDPNFFEKVFSSVSKTRKIIFTYGDATMPNYIYKNEEAIITAVSQQFDLQNSVIIYTVSAVSTAQLATSGCYSFIYSTPQKPSTLIKDIFKNKTYGLQKIFTGMNANNIDLLIAGDDKKVTLQPKTNISALDYINYLVGCMIKQGTATNSVSDDIYILTIHDETTYDSLYKDREIINGKELMGPYFKVEKTNYVKDHSDAYEIDIGYNTATIVSQFAIEKDENYSIIYDYQKELNQQEYVERIDNNGNLVSAYAPTITSKNDDFLTRSEDVTWWTKITKYPINASITIQGLLRPATLMSYVRLNVIFPGGHKHISSGLYIVTKQQDTIDPNGYKTQLSLTKISGDPHITTN